MDEICQTVREKHAMFKPEQLRMWARMIHVGTHTSLDEPPDKPFFRGVKRSQAEASNLSSMPEKKATPIITLSPGRQVDIHSELKKCQELAEIGAIPQESFKSYRVPF